MARCLCGSRRLESPRGLGDDRVLRCWACGHVLLEPGGLAAAAAEPVDRDAVRARFDRLTGASVQQSDAALSARRVVEFADGWLVAPQAEQRPPRALDVESGIAVFPWALAGEGWHVLAMDPDPQWVEIALTMACVPARQADLMTARDLGRHDVVSLNGVLQRAVDPVVVLQRCHGVLEPGGFVYLEVPDGDAAAELGRERPELSPPNLHAFSPTSVSLLVRAAGFSTLRVDRFQTTEGTHILAAFCVAPERREPEGLQTLVEHTVGPWAQLDHREA